MPIYRMFTIVVISMFELAKDVQTKRHTKKKTTNSRIRSIKLLHAASFQSVVIFVDLYAIFIGKVQKRR